jgi:hypothetical protein
MFYMFNNIILIHSINRYRRLLRANDEKMLEALEMKNIII